MNKRDWTIISGCCHILSRGFHSPSEGSFARFLTSDRGRIGCGVVTLDWSVPFPRVAWSPKHLCIELVFAWDHATRGYYWGSPTGKRRSKDFERFPKGIKLRKSICTFCTNQYTAGVMVLWNKQITHLPAAQSESCWKSERSMHCKISRVL